MRVEIRKLGKGDAEELLELRRLSLVEAPFAFLSSPEDDAASSAAAVRAHLSQGQESVVFGAFNPQLVGMLGLYRETHAKAAHKIHLWGMYVRPDARGHGIAGRILAAALDHARTLPGVTTARLGVSETANHAKALYERAGFEIWGIEPEALYVDGQLAREFHMALPLTPEGDREVESS